MADIDIVTLAIANAYTADTANAMGAVKGSPCTITNIVENQDGTRTVTFSWTGTDGTVKTRTTTLVAGPKGETGEKGDKGDKGDRGQAGANGTNGSDGVGISNITASQNGSIVTLNISLTNGTSKQVSFTAPQGSGGSSGNIKVLMDSNGKVLMDSNGKVLTINV